jgi:hypothetical protein
MFIQINSANTIVSIYLNVYKYLLKIQTIVRFTNLPLFSQNNPVKQRYFTGKNPAGNTGNFPLVWSLFFAYEGC